MKKQMKNISLLFLSFICVAASHAKTGSTTIIGVGAKNGNTQVRQFKTEFTNLANFAATNKIDLNKLVQSATITLSCVTITYTTPESVNALQQIAAAGYMNVFLQYADWFWCQGGRCELYPDQCGGGGGISYA